MPGPDAPRCFATRRLNPFLGVAQVLDTGIGHAISIDDVSWQIQIRAKPPSDRRKPHGSGRTDRKYFWFSHWTAAAGDWVHWLAPRLLTLQSLDDTTRSSLEHAARTHAGLVDGQFRLYPRVINDTLLESARVESRLRRSANA